MAQIVKSQTKNEIKQLEAREPESDEYTKVNGISSGVSFDDSERINSELRKKLEPLGYMSFLTGRNFGIDGSDDEIGVLKTTDDLEIIRVQHTGGYNYDIPTEKVISKLKEWDKKYDLEITGAGFDWFDAKFGKMPKNMNSFAQEVYEFCPDVVDQGTETVENLAKEMKDENYLYCWWD